MQGEPPPEVKGVVRTTQQQVARLLQLLWSAWELRQSEAVLQLCHADTDEVAQSTKPTEEPQLEWLQCGPTALSSETSPNRGQAPDQVGDFGGLGWIAEASISEEPGAEKPHAGICAGAAG